MKMRNISLGFLLLSTIALAQTPATVLKQRVEAGEAPGIAMAVLENGKVSYFAEGLANVEKNEKVTSKTLFEIGSISKTFTTTLIALDVSAGTLSLSDPAQKYLPATMTIPSRNDQVITIESLATARSGLPRMPNNFNPADPSNPYLDYTDKEAAAFLKDYVLPRDVGSQYEYSNLGMGLLGFILTQADHKTWEQLVQERIAKPLHMNHTYLSRPLSQYAPMAQGYADGKAVSSWTWNDNSIMQGAGGLLSDAEDMMKYVKAQMDEKSPIHKAALLSQTIRADAGRPGMDIGLGWHIRDKRVIWHNGGTGGFRTFAGFDPEKKIAVVVLTNSSMGADDIGFHFLDSKYELKVIKKVVSVDPALLRSYAGIYELNPQFKITISLEGEQLQAQATGQERFKIYAETDTKFFLKVVNAQVEFVKNASGMVDRMNLIQGGSVQELRRIE